MTVIAGTPEDTAEDRSDIGPKLLIEHQQHVVVDPNRSFALALIDGDADVPPRFLQSGYQGGITFARNVEKAIIKSSSSDQAPSAVMIVVYFTSSPDALKQTLLRAFSDGVSDGSKLATSGQAQASVIKLEGFLKAFMLDPSCETIYLGGTKNTRFINTLRSFSNHVYKDKVTLLLINDTHKAYDSLDLRSTRLLQHLPEPHFESPYPSSPSSALGLFGAPFSPVADSFSFSDGSSQSPVTQMATPTTPAFMFPPASVAPLQDQYVAWSPGTGWSSPSTDFTQSPVEMYRHLSIDSTASGFFDSSISVSANGAHRGLPSSVPLPQSPLPSPPLTNGPTSPPVSMIIPTSMPMVLSTPVTSPVSSPSHHHPHAMSPASAAATMSPVSPLSMNAPLHPAPPLPALPIHLATPVNGHHPVSPIHQAHQQQPLATGVIQLPNDPQLINMALAALKRKIDQTPKRGRPCNMHYRLNQCTHGAKCSLSHRFPFTPIEWQVYPLLVKQLVCRAMLNGHCPLNQETCVFGHRCRFTRESCPFGVKCRFVVAQVPNAHGENDLGSPASPVMSVNNGTPLVLDEPASPSIDQSFHSAVTV